MPAAAFFDLDRTLLLHASGPIIGRHLAAEGLGSVAQVPGAGLFIGLYDLFGETRVNMALTQQFVRTAKGWPIEAVKSAAKNAAVELAAAVPPYARQLIEEHRAAGVKLVIATTTPTVLVEPLAERLGFDDVVATVWAHDGAQLLGRTDGPFVWGPTKRDAIVDWAAANGVGLAESFAYSDSYYDAPMLDLVGNPVAVNADARLAVVAALKGWPMRNFDAPPGALKVLGRELQDWLRPVTRPELFPQAKWSFAGVENIPTDGAAILAFNHRSYFDTVAMDLLVSKSGRPCRFLAKREMFETPGLAQVVKLAGGIPVDRGTGSAEPLQAAIKALEAGELVALAPQGTIPRGPAFFDPVLKGRPGVARLARESGAPVIPVGLWGTEKVWPRSSRLPSFDPVSPPEVSVSVGPPVALGRRGVETATTKIMASISAQLPEEARVAHEPTDDELARTYPPGRQP